MPGGGGVLMPNGHIVTCDWFIKSDNKNMLADEEGAGYTLAHEWGHYFYGVYDEYTNNCVKPVGGFPVRPSIMNYQWNARNGNYDWLNMSVRWRGGITNFGRFENTKKTRQHDIFEESAWETVSRQPRPAESSRWWYWLPKWLGGAGLSIGARVYYPELATVAPQGNNEPVNQLPGTARDELNIIWMGTNAVVQIVIDCSGSMGDENKMQ